MYYGHIVLIEPCSEHLVEIGLMGHRQ
jgi:hypothetical protein